MGSHMQYTTFIPEKVTPRWEDTSGYCFCYLVGYFSGIEYGVHPQKQTWNLKTPPSKRRNTYKQPIFGFHVNFRECTAHGNIVLFGVHIGKHPTRYSHSNSSSPSQLPPLAARTICPQSWLLDAIGQSSTKLTKGSMSCGDG